MYFVNGKRNYASMKLYNIVKLQKASSSHQHSSPTVRLGSFMYAINQVLDVIYKEYVNMKYSFSTRKHLKYANIICKHIFHLEFQFYADLHNLVKEKKLVYYKAPRLISSFRLAKDIQTRYLTIQNIK